MTFEPYTAFLLLPAMLVLLEAGRRVRIRRPNPAGSNTIENAVFGLFGLLLAFTFSGAVSRYDAHRQLLVQEANDIGTGYLRLDLLPPQFQPSLRELFREYTTSRLHMFDAVGAEVSPETARLQGEIWRQAVIAARQAGASPDAGKLLLPAINDMMDITATRRNAFNMHPPAVVFLLLFAFGCGSAFMAGYSMQAERRNWVYWVALSVAVTLTVFATLEIEYPSQGLIRLSHLDRTFVELRDSMK